MEVDDLGGTYNREGPTDLVDEGPIEFQEGLPCLISLTRQNRGWGSPKQTHYCECRGKRGWYLDFRNITYFALQPH